MFNEPCRMCRGKIDGHMFYCSKCIEVMHNDPTKCICFTKHSLEICYGHCNKCGETHGFCYGHCHECGSENLQGYDDGEGYPPNILCKDCGSWNQ